MIPVLRYAGAVVAVVGLGKSGLTAARAIRASGGMALAWDDNESARARAQEEGLTVVKPSEQSWQKIEMVVWSPGIPHTLPQPHWAAELARKMEKPLICDVDLLCESRVETFYVGVTGTNGKSTTTALIEHLMKIGGHRVTAAGNIGVPVMEAPDLSLIGTYVLELSSYQLELVPHLSLDVAVWTNITPDHLSRHGSMEGYIQAKRRLFDTPKPTPVAVIGIDDPYSRKVYDDLVKAGAHKMMPVSVTGPVKNGICVRDGVLIDATGRSPRTICDLKEMPALPGAHNWQNAALAYAAARARGVAPEAIVRGLRSFPGLAHRQQKVAVIEDVAFINDSKATNADAASKAIQCYDDILWIAGGMAKEGGIDSLAPLFPRIKHAFLIGQAAEDFAQVLAAANVPYTLSGTLEVAVEQADEMADCGDTVLLSPACASFDQFRSFEHRGDEFMRIVHELAEESGDEGEAEGEIG